MRAHLSITTLVLAAGLSACGSYGASGTGSGGGSATAAGIETQDYMFVPTSLSLKAGESVTLAIKNTGKKEHNFSIDGTTVSQDVEAGDTKSVTFTVPKADSVYFCKYHRAGGMKGTLAVGTGGAAPAATQSPYSSY